MLLLLRGNLAGLGHCDRGDVHRAMQWVWVPWSVRKLLHVYRRFREWFRRAQVREWKSLLSCQEDASFQISPGLINLLSAWWCLSWDSSVGYELRGDTFLGLLWNRVDVAPSQCHTQCHTQGFIFWMFLITLKPLNQFIKVAMVCLADIRWSDRWQEACKHRNIWTNSEKTVNCLIIL